MESKTISREQGTHLQCVNSEFTSEWEICVIEYVYSLKEPEYKCGDLNDSDILETLELTLDLVLPLGTVLSPDFICAAAVLDVITK